jgi:hypothetical protein
LTPPAAGGNNPGAPGLGDEIPRASYARLISEGEGFGWLFGAWLGTVKTEGITTESSESNSKNKHKTPVIFKRTCHIYLLDSCHCITHTNSYFCSKIMNSQLTYNIQSDY